MKPGLRGVLPGGVLAACGAALLVASAVVWLKIPHDFAAPAGVARTFLELLRKGAFARAFELTSKNALVGRTVGGLQQVSARQLCNASQVVATAPLQTNGNRLRRWLRGDRVEIPELRVEFSGQCLLSVVLHPTPDGRWQVFYFESHAG